MANHPFLAQLVAAVATVVFTVSSLGLYAYYFRRVVMDYRGRVFDYQNLVKADANLLHQLCKLVDESDAPRIRNLFEAKPQLRNRKLMYGIVEWGHCRDGYCPSHNLTALGYAIVAKPAMIPVLLDQGFDINAPVKFYQSSRDPAPEPQSALDLAIAQIGGRAMLPVAAVEDRLRRVLQAGARPWDEAHKARLHALIDSHNLFWRNDQAAQLFHLAIDTPEAFLNV